MNTGWVMIHRSLIEWEWFQDQNTLQVFMYLLLMANHKPHKYQGINLQRGQLITGRKKIAQVTGLSEQSVRTSLKRLKTTNNITSTSTNKYSIISIVNYDKYQTKNESTNQPYNQQDTNNQPATNQQLTTYKNDKNVKNEKNKPPKVPLKGEQLERFNLFWASYPRRVGRGAAETSWKKYNPSKDLLGEILQAIEKAKKSDQWKRDGGQYIPNPATWLNQKRWEDELEIEVDDNRVTLWDGSARVPRYLCVKTERGWEEKSRVGEPSHLKGE